MDYKIYDDEVFPFLMIDNFYNETEEEMIWNELEYHSIVNNFIYDKGDKNNGEGGVAVDSNGIPMAKLTRIYLDEIYRGNRNNSNILKCYFKIVSDNVIEHYMKTTPAWVTFDSSDYDVSQVSYYENDYYYKSHFDSFMHTALVWFYRKPKKFTGGDLKFTQSGQVVECIHNRMILFPSYYMHEVSNVNMDEKYLNQGLGRFCLSHFYNCDFRSWMKNKTNDN